LQPDWSTLVRALLKALVTLVAAVVLGYMGMQKYFDWLTRDLRPGRSGPHDAQAVGKTARE
jgi:hypothetical protein